MDWEFQKRLVGILENETDNFHEPLFSALKRAKAKFIIRFSTLWKTLKIIFG